MLRRYGLGSSRRDSRARTRKPSGGLRRGDMRLGEGGVKLLVQDLRRTSRRTRLTELGVDFVVAEEHGLALGRIGQQRFDHVREASRCGLMLDQLGANPPAGDEVDHADVRHADEATAQQVAERVGSIDDDLRAVEQRCFQRGSARCDPGGGGLPQHISRAAHGHRKSDGPWRALRNEPTGEFGGDVVGGCDDEGSIGVANSNLFGRRQHNGKNPPHFLAATSWQQSHARLARSPFGQRGSGETGQLIHKGMADEIHRQSGVAEQLTLEGKNHQKAIHRSGQRPDSRTMPSPDLWADEVENAEAAAFEGAREPQVEPGVVHQNGQIGGAGFDAPEDVAPHTSHKTGMPQHFQKAHDRRLAHIVEEFRAGGAKPIAADAPKFRVQPSLLPGPDNGTCVEISGNVAGDDQDGRLHEGPASRRR